MSRDFAAAVRSLVFISLAALLACATNQAALAGNYSPGGLGVGSLDYWLDANYGVEVSASVLATPGQDVQIWRDRSGANDAIQNTVASRPTYQSGGPNSTNTLFFQGVGSSAVPKDWLAAAMSTITNNFSVFAVAQRNGTHDTTDVQATSGTGGTSGQYYLFGPSHRSSNGGSGLSVGTNGLSVYEHGDGYMPPLAKWAPGGTPVGTGYNIIGYEYTAKQPRIYMNGSLQHTGLTSTKANVFAPFEIGGNSSYGGLDGRISEAFVFDRTLNNTEKVVVNNYLSSKFDLNIGAVDRFAGDSVGLGNNDRDVFGVGRTTVSDAVISAGAAGLNFRNAIVDNGEYLLAGHNQATNGWTETDAFTHWDRIWYLDNNGGTVSADLEFDFSDSDLADTLPSGTNLQLFYANDLSLDWEFLGSAAKVGDTVTFQLSNLANGFYTIGIAYVPEPGSLTLLTGGFLLLTQARRKQRRAGRGV